MNTPLSAHIDMDHLGDLRNAEVRRGEQLLAIVVTSEDLDPVARDLSDETFCRAFNDKQMALCRKFAAVEELIEAVYAKILHDEALVRLDRLRGHIELDRLKEIVAKLAGPEEVRHEE